MPVDSGLKSLTLAKTNALSTPTNERRMQPRRSRLSRRQSAVPPTHMTLPHPPRSRPCALVPFVHRSVAPLRTCPLLADICCGLLCLGLVGRGLLGNPIVRDRAAPTWLWNTSPTAFTARKPAAYVPNVGSRPAHAGALLFPVVDGCGDILEAAVFSRHMELQCSILSIL